MIKNLEEFCLTPFELMLSKCDAKLECVSEITPNVQQYEKPYQLDALISTYVCNVEQHMLSHFVRQTQTQPLDALKSQF